MNLKKLNSFALTAATVLATSVSTSAQISTSQLAGQRINTITTAVPFLLISPDSRSSAMGDAGVALSPDANSVHWNPAKLAFIDEKNTIGFSMSYSPWLRNLVKDINLAYLSGYKRIDKNSTVGMSLRYFSLGNITFTDIVGNNIRDFKPNEFAIDIAYSRKLSSNFGAGIVGRYINSNLTGGVSSQGVETKAGQSVAADLSMYYQSNKFSLSDKDATINVGMNISNIGAKMSYTANADRDFLPTNMRLGTAFNLNLDQYNKLTFALDANKLLVPTRPVYQLVNGSEVLGPDLRPIVYSGRDNNIGVAQGIFGSFTDAPGTPIVDDNGSTIGIEKGSRFKEEMNEINLCFGTEYLYNDIFAVRGGYFHESPTKGNRRFISLGAGVKYSKFQLDLSYLIALTQNSPIANTIRFTMRFDFGTDGIPAPTGVTD
jgi:hypothetical protein